MGTNIAVRFSRSVPAMFFLRPLLPHYSLDDANLEGFGQSRIRNLIRGWTRLLVPCEESSTMSGTPRKVVKYLIPSPTISYRAINGRAETVDKAPSFRKAFAKRRCLIPANGFLRMARKRTPCPHPPGNAAGRRGTRPACPAEVLQLCSRAKARVR
jgi:hypothetical protein